MKQIISLFILWITISVQGQTSPIDSLIRQLEKKSSPNEQLKIRQQLNAYYLNTNPEKLIENNQQLIQLARHTHQPKLIGKAYRYLSEAGLRLHNFDQAKRNAEKALKIDDSLKNYTDMILDYNQLGRIYYNFDQPQKAISLYNKAIDLYKKHPVGQKMDIIYGNIGAAYNRLNRPYESLKYFLKQADFADKYGKIVQKSKVNYNIGYTYMQMDQFKKAEKYFKKALQDSAKINLKDYVYANYHALGMLYSRWKKYDKALKMNKIALDYYNRTKNKMYQFDLHNNNAAIYLKQGKYKKAIAEAQQALKIARQIHFKLGEQAAKTTLANIYIKNKQYSQAEKILNELKKDASIQNYELKQALYDDLYQLYKHKGQYKKALTNLEKLKKLSDSILKSQRDSKITEVETRYQTAKKEKENLRLKAEKVQQQLLLEQESKRNTYLSAGFGTAVLILGIFGFYYRRNKKQKEIIEHLQKDLHHRVKNNLSVIDALIEDIKDDFEDDSIHQRLVELQNRINSINEIHRQLYQNKDITRLDLKTYIDKISQTLQESFGNKSVKIINNIPGKIKLGVKQSFPIGLIVNEFITNSFKYAFAPGQAGLIKIDLIDNAQNYTLILKDNGKGLPPDLDLQNLDSFGLSIMQLLSKQLKGKFTIKGDEGVEIKIEFPK